MFSFLKLLHNIVKGFDALLMFYYVGLSLLHERVEVCSNRKKKSTFHKILMIFFLVAFHPQNLVFLM